MSSLGPWRRSFRSKRAQTRRCAPLRTSSGRSWRGNSKEMRSTWAVWEHGFWSKVWKKAGNKACSKVYSKAYSKGAPKGQEVPRPNPSGAS